MKKIIQLLSFTIIITSGYVSPLLADSEITRNILNAFQSIQVVQGEFEQHRKMPVFANAFVSAGKFLSVRNHGLIWETVTPAPSTLIMTPGKVTQKTRGREQTFQASGTGYDGLGVLLPALLDGDLPLLQSYFSVNTQQQPGGWQLTLIPLSTELQSVVSEVNILGSHGQPDEITMAGPNGDQTRIIFTALSLSQEAPDAASLAAFQ